MSHLLHFLRLTPLFVFNGDYLNKFALSMCYNSRRTARLIRLFPTLRQPALAPPSSIQFVPCTMLKPYATSGE